jgi:aminopeptidase N
MSTYLVAFALTDFECVSGVTPTNIEVNVCGRPEAIRNNEGNFALEVSMKVIPYYEQSYNISYPLSKCDHFALPDFAIGKCYRFYYESSTIYISSLTHRWHGKLGSNHVP